MSIKKQALAITAIYLLSGCATIIDGTQQNISVNTPEASGAKCQLTDSKGANWYVENTPGTAKVAKGNGPMTIICKKDGYKTTSIKVEESLAAPLLGNVILGGGVGVIVDAASGAAQNYPEKATLWLEPSAWQSEAAKQDWLNKKAAFEQAEAKAKEDLKASNNPPPAKRY